MSVFIGSSRAAYDARVLIVIFLLIFLLLTLSLQLVDGFLRAILDQITLVVDAGPFGFSVGDVQDSSRVEHVATSVASVTAVDLSLSIVA